MNFVPDTFIILFSFYNYLTHQALFIILLLTRQLRLRELSVFPKVVASARKWVSDSSVHTLKTDKVDARSMAAVGFHSRWEWAAFHRFRKE